ncbi:hypothetical protein BH20GEM2_BH20GEM2_00830 [soil metagenome]
MTLQCSQIGFTLARTFIFASPLNEMEPCSLAASDLNGKS